ncbi:MAG: aminodeoxychorismate/anthranilate synthase component II [Treponema sp.]|nr:aminodeoxychorismate/anthranilate synthase component II [Treponema sp.]MCL2251385.1 aminodeoxychorismate/anthranilate synthase component II [Treponema sp.]
MILLIDNYDSFSYNLYQLIGSINPDIKVARNDALSIEEIKKLSPSHIVISPGPGKPSDAGICIELIKQLYTSIPIFGICLGHQAIFEAFGGTVSYAKELMHGKSSLVTVDTGNALFKGMPPVIKAARYHSLAGIKSTLPECLKITAKTEDGEIMAVSHKEFPVYGVQFHPESILTSDGKIIAENFILNNFSK